MSDFEMVGYDVGAIRRRAPVARGKLAATRARKIWLGLGSISVPAGGTANLSVTVQRPIQGQRLILAHTGAAGVVTVTDIKVGAASQLAGLSAMPVEAFANIAVDNDVDIAPAGRGTEFTVELANSSGGAITVTGVLIGPSTAA